MSFKTFYLSLVVNERADFAERSGTTVGLCHQLAYTDAKRVELGLADAMVAVSKGRLTLDDIPLTSRAQFQRSVRRLAPFKRRPTTQKEAANA